MFKKDFAWGAATAAYQIEGAAFEDGKGANIWDVFSRKEGAVFQGHTGDVGGDHYHRYKEDVTLMKEIGLNAYRFSLSWARIIPEGTGKVNPKGIEFYSNLIDELTAAGITPYITLYHWDLPMALYYKGGWMNPESSDWFAEYARVAAENFSGRVRHFITFNEPQCFIGLGFMEGAHAPGLKMSHAETVPMTHNVLVAHGKAVKALREHSKNAQPLQIGFAPCFSYPYPQEETPENIEAARKAAMSMPGNPVQYAAGMTWWSDPVYLGHYPEDGLRLYEKYLPAGWQKDMEIIRQPLDFCGQNTYWGHEINAKGEFTKEYDGYPKTNMGWSVTPRALKYCAKFLYERYKLPVIITESGLACHDIISLDGKVHDPNRTDYLHRYLLALKEAASEGADIGGYFVWSLTDNFEWAYGYDKRFGLIFIDYVTKKRIIKDSGYWYKSVIETNGDKL